MAIQIQNNEFFLKLIIEFKIIKHIHVISDFTLKIMLYLRMFIILIYIILKINVYLVLFPG